uniref:PWI domain-containing protein n=1 Tax=Spongospora subterranea TaxID=70186 RepID=A0A0H5R7K0_9EUKA|eukprot:CRZ09781.1 hypothetical protein [Spongospora subterranea]
MQSTFFRGTSHEQDSRFSNKNRQLVAKLKCPSNFNTKVDMSKVALETIKPWISQRITDLLGIEDDVVVNLCFNMLETGDIVDPRELQINLTGFMGANSKLFVSELWTMLISAQSSEGGIPADLLRQYLDHAKTTTVSEVIPTAATQSGDISPNIRGRRRSASPRNNRRSLSPRRRRSRSPRRPASPRRHISRISSPSRKLSPSPRRRRSSRSPRRRRPSSPNRRRRRKSRSPGKRRSPSTGVRTRRKSRSKSAGRRRHRSDHSERKKRRRHRRRRSQSKSSSSSVSPPRDADDKMTKNDRTIADVNPVESEPIRSSADSMDPRAAEDNLRILALRSIVINKNKAARTSASRSQSPPNHS